MSEILLRYTYEVLFCKSFFTELYHTAFPVPILLGVSSIVVRYCLLFGFIANSCL